MEWLDGEVFICRYDIFIENVLCRCCLCWDGSTLPIQDLELLRIGDFSPDFINLSLTSLYAPSSLFAYALHLAFPSPLHSLSSTRSPPIVPPLLAIIIRYKSVIVLQTRILFFVEGGSPTDFIFQNYFFLTTKDWPPLNPISIWGGSPRGQFPIKKIKKNVALKWSTCSETWNKQIKYFCPSWPPCLPNPHPKLLTDM